MFRITHIITVLILLTAVVSVEGAKENDRVSGIPVIYCTDLFHPYDDPDDHLDIASLYAMPEIDIKAVILEQGIKQKKKPGLIPVSQLNHITGKTIPCFIGLSEKLKSPNDKAVWQPEEYQLGVEKIIETLKASSKPVTIITVGSLRDVAAAYNRSPELFKQKVGRLLIFIGEASKKGFIECNVGLDTNAYIRIMHSGLPVYWVPCFDGGVWRNKGRASYWDATHTDLFEYLPPRVMNFFIYALQKKQDKAYLEFIDKPVNPVDKNSILTGHRGLFCTAVFPYIVGRKIVQRDNDFFSVPKGTQTIPSREIKLFDFREVFISIDPKGNVEYDGVGTHKVMQFRIINQAVYAKAMTSITVRLLADLDSQAK